MQTRIQGFYRKSRYLSYLGQSSGGYYPDPRRGSVGGFTPFTPPLNTHLSVYSTYSLAPYPFQVTLAYDPQL